jgi:hypothetical protein
MADRPQPCFKQGAAQQALQTARMRRPGEEARALLRQTPKRGWTAKPPGTERHAAAAREKGGGDAASCPIGRGAGRTFLLRRIGRFYFAPTLRAFCARILFEANKTYF